MGRDRDEVRGEGAAHPKSDRGFGSYRGDSVAPVPVVPTEGVVAEDYRDPDSSHLFTFSFHIRHKLTETKNRVQCFVLT